MSLENSQQQTARQILQSEIDCAHSLLQSLDQEYEALAEHRAETLEEIVRNKQEKIRQLEHTSRQRERLLATVENITVCEQHENNKHYQFNGNKQLNDLWDELVDIAERCRHKNRVNGSIVDLISRQSRHALDILQGIVPGGGTDSEVYDQSGRTQALSSKRSLVHV
ncbi:MAG TPA: flagellar protein FlgN [Gammaproteobacteria bacterium]|nr:flagellar protein FlgN [Gammaproteobacteria bacterium]